MLPPSIERDHPKPLARALDPGRPRVPVSLEQPAGSLFDDDIYGRVFIVRLRDAAGDTPVDLQITARAIVLDESDGMAAAADAPGGVALQEPLEPSGPPARTVELHRASPDPDGLWRWPIDAALGHSALRVTLKFSPTAQSELSLVAEGRADEVLDVRLPEAASLHGRFEAGSMLLPGHSVQLTARWSWRGADGCSWAGSARTSVDEARYRFERNVLGHADLSLEDGDTREQALGPVPTPLAPGMDLRWDIRREELVELEVQVVDATTREPLPEALVSLPGRGDNDSRERDTGADGCARFLGAEFAAGSPIHVACEGYLPDVAMLPDRSASGPLRVVVPLGRGMQLRGRIVDVVGRGVPGADVSLALDAGGLSQDSITDDSGWFTLERVCPGRGQLLVCAADGFGTGHFPIGITAGMAPLTLTLLAAAQLSVQVQHADGRPVSDGQVTLLPFGQIVREATRLLDDQGRAEFDAPDLRGELLVTAHGGTTADGVASSRLRLVPGTAQELRLVLAQRPPGVGLPPTVQVELNVFDPRSQAPLSAPLWARISPAVAGSNAHETLLVDLGPAERSIALPRGLVRLGVGASAASWASAKLILDTTGLADGAVIDVVLVEAP